MACCDQCRSPNLAELEEELNRLNQVLEEDLGHSFEELSNSSSSPESSLASTSTSSFKRFSPSEFLVQGKDPIIPQLPDPPLTYSEVKEELAKLESSEDYTELDTEFVPTDIQSLPSLFDLEVYPTKEFIDYLLKKTRKRRKNKNPRRLLKYPRSSSF